MADVTITLSGPLAAGTYTVTTTPVPPPTPTPPPSPPPTPDPSWGPQWHSEWSPKAGSNAAANFVWIKASYGTSWSFGYMYASTMRSDFANEIQADLGNEGKGVVQVFWNAGSPAQYGAPPGIIVPFRQYITRQNVFKCQLPPMTIVLPYPDNGDPVV